ncbi:MAG: DUF503 domain-containing protein [Eubacteriales bacterium]|nr:DUF503 domain-containing protein [Eubacteriales bacterium]
MSGLNSQVRVVAIEISLDLHSSFSLKEKRKLRQSLLERLKRKFNLSIIESDLQDDYRRLELCAAYLAINESTAYEMIERIKEYILDLTEGEAVLRDFYYEIY